jgi:hypothetical protein
MRLRWFPSIAGLAALALSALLAVPDRSFAVTPKTKTAPTKSAPAEPRSKTAPAPIARLVSSVQAAWNTERVPCAIDRRD